MHPKALEVMKKYRDLTDLLSHKDPGSQDYIKTAKERAELEPFVDKYNALATVEKELEDNDALMRSDEDPEIRDMAKAEIDRLYAKQDALDKEVLAMLLPKDERKSRNIIVEIRAGTGGDEAAIFAGDLFRMYTRYAELKRWKIEIIDFNEIGLGGYKEVIFSMKGKDVYGYLKYESGVHRVQRVPLTEAGGRLHTSTASVAIMPEAEEVDVHIDDKDLRIDVYRASGAGGQHVNKTDSAVRITHIPSGVVVTCQDERSQLQNRDRAMGVLRAKLYDMELQKKMSAEVDLRRSMIGNQERAEKIRTYNYPQNRVTDHRINLTLYKLEFIMNGDLDELINALIFDEQQSMLKTLD
ncbi:MAG: peptide chain release factor 1 [Spirochaetes bacterium GWF1_51_8]|nr:MAG: peptide chain release factor 1 [Spirochaetes bacterium GWF1_51_8]